MDGSSVGTSVVGRRGEVSVGSIVGDLDCVIVGERVVSCAEGESVGLRLVVAAVSIAVGIEDFSVVVGWLVGCCEEGKAVGRTEGFVDGKEVGSVSVGNIVGRSDGLDVGDSEETLVGEPEGDRDGL